MSIVISAWVPSQANFYSSCTISNVLDDVSVILEPGEVSQHYFQNYTKGTRAPFVIYSDIDTIVHPMEDGPTRCLTPLNCTKGINNVR